MVPNLSRRQREAFSLIYAAPTTPARVARALGVSVSNASELLAQLQFKGLIQPTTRHRPAYMAAPWTRL